MCVPVCSNARLRERDWKRIAEVRVLLRDVVDHSVPTLVFNEPFVATQHLTIFTASVEYLCQRYTLQK